MVADGHREVPGFAVGDSEDGAFRTAFCACSRPMRDALARVPRGDAEMVAAAIRTIFAHPDAEHVHSRLDVIAGMLGRPSPRVEAMLRLSGTSPRHG